MMLPLTMVRRAAAPDEVAAEQLAQCARCWPARLRACTRTARKRARSVLAQRSSAVE
jgi:hypothetical protein